MRAKQTEPDNGKSKVRETKPKKKRHNRRVIFRLKLEDGVLTTERIKDV